METKIRMIGKDNKYGYYKYWYAENKNGEVIGIISVKEIDKSCMIHDIDYIQLRESKIVLNNLLDEALNYLKQNNELVEIQVLDNMKDIIQVLEEHNFEMLYKSGQEQDGFRAVRYKKKLK